MNATLFKTHTVKIDTLGEYLQQVRKILNLDMKTVSLLTQIKPSYLELLEAGRFEQLPADVYIRGFLKSLAEFYHIKEQVLIDQYEKEQGYDLAPPILQLEKTNWLSLTPRTLIIGFSLLVALTAVIYVLDQIRSVWAPPYLSLLEPAGDQTVDGNSIVVSGKGEIGAEIFINNQPVLLDSTGQFTEILLLSPGLNVVEISEKNKFGKISKLTRQITSKSTSLEPVVPAAINLTINIGPGSAWVYLEVDGAFFHPRTIPP